MTYGLVGIREDLEDDIYMISPEDTPFLSMLPRTKAKQTRHEWQTDELAAAGSNAQVEGDEASFQTIAPTVRISNLCQISRKTVIVSGTAEAVDSAGRDSEYEYQFAKRAKELKRDMEAILTGNQSGTAGGTNVPRTLGSLEAWIETNVSKGASNPANGGYSNGIINAATDGTAGELRSLTESMLKTVLRQCYNEGGEPKFMMVGPFNKQRVSEGFAGIATQYRENKRAPAVIIATADVYVSDFGEISIFPNRFSRDRTATILDMNMWAIAYLRGFQNKRLAKTGDAEKGMVLAEYTLVSRNQKASGKIADLRTS